MTTQSTTPQPELLALVRQYGNQCGVTHMHVERDNRAKRNDSGDQEHRIYAQILGALGRRIQDERADAARKAKVTALREAARDLNESTQADVNNFIERPAPTFSHSDRYADVLWLSHRADELEATDARQA